MRALVVGAGPGGLYAAILLRLARPDAEVTVLERNPAAATYGWGVVFSDQTLGTLQEADPVSYERITERFVHWESIDVWFRDQRMRAHGNAFAGMARRELLLILQRRAAELGATLRFEIEVGAEDLEAYDAYDLVIVADGVNSLTRQTWEEHFGPSYDVRPSKYVWFGTTRRPDVFSYMVRPTEQGIFQGTMYPFDDSLSTFIVECPPAAWERAGLHEMSEQESLAWCQELFSDLLDGHPLLSNRSLWLNFTTVRNRTLHRGHVVLVGDAAHTAHFSIGSGTKLAMEDAIALVEAVDRFDDLREALVWYERGREPVVEATQEAAVRSLTWFENLDRYLDLAPRQFMFNFLTRSGRVSYDNLRVRDRGFAEGFDRWYAQALTDSPVERLVAPPPLFTPMRLAELALPNRAVFALGPDLGTPEGVPGEAHQAAIARRAAGGAGLVLTDLVAVEPQGRVTELDAGLWSDAQEAAWASLCETAHAEGSCSVGLRLGHAGRRGSCRPRAGGVGRPLATGGWPLLAPSAIAYHPAAPPPEAMDRADMERVREAFAAAAERAARAGVDLLELGMAHGYLLGSFLSPLSNQREDEYGGDLAARARFPLEVLDAVRAVWPRGRPLAVWLTASDCVAGGLEPSDSLELAPMLDCDLVHVAAGHTVPNAHLPYHPYFLVPLSETLRMGRGIATLVRGRISSTDDANSVLAAGRADLCLLDLPELVEADERPEAPSAPKQLVAA